MEMSLAKTPQRDTRFRSALTRLERRRGIHLNLLRRFNTAKPASSNHRPTPKGRAACFSEKLTICLPPVFRIKDAIGQRAELLNSKNRRYPTDLRVWLP